MFTGDDAPAAPKTMDAFNAEQRRLQEQTRMSQLNAAESLHQYRGTVDEEELKRRAAAEELRRKEIEARQGLHGYRAKQFGGSNNARSAAAKDYREADVKAGERRDDVMSGNIFGFQLPSLGDESVLANGPSSDALPRGDENTQEDVAPTIEPAPEHVIAPDTPAPTTLAGTASDALAAPEPQQQTALPTTSNNESFEDETFSEQANAVQYSKEISVLSDVSDRAKLMRQNITFSFGFICKVDVAPPPVTFNPTVDHKDFEAKVKASGAGGGDAWGMLGRMMSTAETIVQSALLKREEVGGNFDSSDPFAPQLTVEGVLYDPDYKPYVVEITDDASFTPPTNQPDVVRRVIKAIVPIFIRSGHVETTKSSQGDIIGALRTACAGGAFSEAAINASDSATDIF